jgi:hypothetical protein
MDIVALKAELTDDPLGRVYSAMDDQTAADSLNTENRAVNKTTMTGREVAAEIVDSEYDALTDALKSQVLALVASEDVDPFGFAANVIKDIFPASDTLTALQAARVETLSRAVELGIGVAKTGHVEEARK